MKKRYILLIVSIIMTIAYIDLVDSFKHFDKIISQMIKLDSNIKTEVVMSYKKP